MIICIILSFLPFYVHAQLLLYAVERNIIKRYVSNSSWLEHGYTMSTIQRIMLQDGLRSISDLLNMWESCTISEARHSDSTSHVSSIPVALSGMLFPVSSALSMHDPWFCILGLNTSTLSDPSLFLSDPFRSSVWLIDQLPSWFSILKNCPWFYVKRGPSLDSEDHVTNWPLPYPNSVRQGAFKNSQRIKMLERLVCLKGICLEWML